MIDEKILDEIFPLPDLEDLKEEKVAELEAEGFVITNFQPGGVFYTLLMIVLRAKLELTKLLRLGLNNATVTHADGAWLDLKAADYSKKRKYSTKTQGLVTVNRSAGGEAVKIPKGFVFKTEKDINGEELRFFSMEPVILQKDALSVGVLVEAEKEGSRYNVPSGHITRTLTYLGSGVDTITNGSDWITREGSDTEDDDSLRARSLRSWSERATRPIADTIRNAAEAVPGVLFAQVDDLHPRGQGTYDVIITGTAGEATEGLLDTVAEEVEKIAGPYDNIVVKSAVTVSQPVELRVTIPGNVSEDDVVDRIKSVLAELLAIRKSRSLNTLTHADIIQTVKNRVSKVSNVKVLVPSDDVFLDKDKVIVLGGVTVNVQKGVTA